MLSKKHRKASKRARERYRNLSEEEKNKKRKRAPVKIFLKKVKKKSINIIVNVIQVFLKIKNRS